jgi:hypothetical protein
MGSYQQERFFLLGKDYSLDRCPLMGTSLYLYLFRKVDNYRLKYDKKGRAISDPAN